MDGILILMSGDQHRKAFELLSELLASRHEKPLWIVVCGGSALQARGIIQRATKDVDIFATRDEFSGIEPAYPLSDTVKQAIKQVADLLDLPQNWLNASTSFLLLPLKEYPPYFWEDFMDEEYGTHLKISYLSRKGLITLKILAAIQRDAARDAEDLIALQPSETDTIEALDWCIATTVELASSQLKINSILTLLNHESLIEKYTPEA
jgi:hypothetical protein